MKPSDVYFVRGQFNRAASEGVDWMASDAVTWNISGSRIRTYNFTQWQQMRDDINSRAAMDVNRFCIPYSCGANALTWILAGVDFQGQHGVGMKPGIVFDYAWFIDPTWATVITPISTKQIKALTHFRGTFPDFVGHGELVYNPPRPQFERVEVFIEHLWIDIHLRPQILADLRRRMTS